MRKLLTLFLAFSSLCFVVNAQNSDLEKERLDKISKFQKKEISAKFLKGESTAIKAIECLPDATYSNAPIDFTGAVTSNTNAGYVAAQMIEGFSDPISAIRFFGIQAFNDGSAWSPMNDVDPYEFEISFYEDNAGLPGNLISSETVSINHVNTEAIFADVYNVFHWDYIPASPIDGLTETFWVGIANTAADAWFLWIDQPAGLGATAQSDAGVWGGTDYDSFGICIVPVLAEPGAPEAPADLVITPAEMGAVEANLTWTNPSLTFDGTELTELTTIELWVNDAVDAEYINSSPVIGGSETYDFTGVDPGFYTFTVYGTNSVGQGVSASQTVWLGNDVPAAPENVVLVADGNNGSITWDAPTDGLHGGYIDMANTTYSITRMPDEVELATDITEVEYVDLTVPEIGNYYYIVTAHNDEGEGGSGASNPALLAAEGFLVWEGFEDMWPPAGWTNSGWAHSLYGGAHTGENWAYSNLAGSMLTTPTIALPIDEVYELSFFYRVESANYPQDFDLMISIDGGEFETLEEFRGLTNTTYSEFKVVLDAYAGSEIQLQFAGLTGEGGWDFGVCIDDVWIYKLADNDLAALAVSGNSTPSVGIESTYTISVENVGIQTQDTYTVKLMREGDVEIGSVPGVSIANGEIVEFDIPWTPQEGDEGETYLYAIVELASDEQLTNNQSANLNLMIQSADIIAITIGSGANYPAVRIPFDFYYKNSFSQTLYFADELGIGGGAMTSIAYTNNFATDLPAKEIKVWIGETEMEDLSAGWVDPTTLTLVYEGTVDFPQGENTIVIPFDMPYVYTGGNIVVYTNRVWEDQYFSSSDRFYGTLDEGSVRTRRVSADGTGPLDPLSPGDGTVTDWHPNTTLFFSTEGLGSLDGLVTDGTNPIEGVEISVVGTMAKAVTNENGEYLFPYLLAGTYDVSYEMFGYNEHLEVDVLIEEDATTTIDVQLVEIPKFTVSGIVEGNDEILLEGASIELAGYDTYTATAGVDGSFTMADVYEGTYTLTITEEGYDTDVQEVIVDGDLDLGTIILAETIVDPYALTVDVDNVNRTALLSWNGSFGGSILLVDHDASNAVDFTDDGAIMAATLDYLELDYTLFEADATTFNGPTLEVMQQYDAIIWVTGEGWQNNQTMTATDHTNLAQYLDNGGKLILSTQDYVWDFYSQDPSYTFTAGQFAYDYLGVRSVTQDVWWETFPDAQTAIGSTGSFAEGMVLDLGNIYGKKEGLTTDNITDHVGQAVIDITMDPNGVAAIKYQNAIYSSASLTAIADADARANFIMAALNSLIGKNEKAFVGFNIYLNEAETPVNAEPIEGTSYLFEDLAYGEYTASVEAVYTTGVSNKVSIDFDIVEVVEVTFSVVDGNGSLTATVSGLPISSGEGVPAGSNVVFTATPSENYQILQWTLQGNVIPSFTETEFTVNDVQTSTNVTVEFQLISGINAEAFESIIAYPNPFSNEISISSPEKVKRIVVSNLIGQLVLDENLNGRKAVSTDQLNAGVYLITIEGFNGERVVRKMIKK